MAKYSKAVPELDTYNAARRALQKLFADITDKTDELQKAISDNDPRTASKLKNELANLRNALTQTLNDFANAKATAEVALQAYIDAQKKKTTSNFPIDEKAVKALTKGNALAGSSDADVVLATDADGKKYALKSTDQTAHAKNEILSDEIYRDMGVRVPKTALITVDGKECRVSEYIDGESLEDYLKKASSNDKNAVLSELTENLDIDCVLGNWDVYGIDKKNLVVDKDGHVWRIDNGGTMRFRGKGQTKDSGAWGSGSIDDFWSIPDNNKDLGTVDVGKMLQKASNRDWSNVLNKLSASDRTEVEERLKLIKKMAAKVDELDKKKKFANDIDARNKLLKQILGTVDSGLDQVPADNTLKREVVSGADISKKISSTDLLQLLQTSKSHGLHEINEKQGFNGYPQVITDDNEFKKACDRASYVGHRGIGDGSISLKKAIDGLKNGDFYLECSGGNVHGNGLYIAGDASKNHAHRNRCYSEAQSYGNSNSRKHYTVLSMTLDPSTKLIDETKVRELQRKETDPVIRQMDRGAYAALKGYDGLYASFGKKRGAGLEYTVLFNRTKLILKDDVEFF